MHIHEQHSRRHPVSSGTGPRPLLITGRAHIIVVGNAKGGSGKSTTAMHVMTRLMAQGYTVHAMDLDGQQQTLGRYLQNRAHFAAQKKLALAMPTLHTVVEHSYAKNGSAQQVTYGKFVSALQTATQAADCVVIDCPGSDTFLSRLGHLVADTLLTPLNDSFIDLDLLAHIDPDSHRMIMPSWYSEMVWHLRKRRFLTEKLHTDWVVVRNRLAHTDAKNKRAMGDTLKRIGPTLGFRTAQGFGERVIFRELFLRGLTLSDLKRYKTGIPMTMNHVAAHQEIKALVQALQVAPPAAERQAS